MPRDQDDKKVINFIPVDPDSHSQLVELANQRGMKLNEFLGLMVDEWALTWSPPKKKRSERALFWNWVDLRRRKRLQDMVYQMVSLYQQLGESEELADLIEAQCDIAGISPVDLQLIHQEVASDPLSSIIAENRQGTKFSRCITWLSETFKNLGPALSVGALKKLAEAEGFQWSMVERAKREIRETWDLKVEIVSRREGSHWEWVMVDRESNEPVQKGDLVNANRESGTKDQPEE